jgi:hypothetical protein
MIMRITWGKLNPGTWNEFERGVTGRPHQADG